MVTWYLVYNDLNRKTKCRCVRLLHIMVTIVTWRPNSYSWVTIRKEYAPKKNMGVNLPYFFVSPNLKSQDLDFHWPLSSWNSDCKQFHQYQQNKHPDFSHQTIVLCFRVWNLLEELFVLLVVVISTRFFFQWGYLFSQHLWWPVGIQDRKWLFGFDAC